MRWLSGRDRMRCRRRAGLGGVVALVLVVSMMGCEPSSSSEATSTGRLRAGAEVDVSPVADRSGRHPAAPLGSPTPAPVPGGDVPVPARPGAAPPRPTGTAPAGRASPARAEPTDGATAGSGARPSASLRATRAAQATSAPTPPVRDVERITRSWPGTACGAPRQDRARGAPENFIHWPADGSAVLFTLGGGIHALAADGSRLWQVAEAAPADRHLLWLGWVAPFTLSPDGEQIVFATCEYPDPNAEARSEGGGLEEGDYNFELARVQVDGTQQQRLTANGVSDNYPAWSPDGRRIAFISGDEGRFVEAPAPPHLYTMAPDGSDVQLLQTESVAAEYFFPPRWSPDGRRLAFLGSDRSAPRTAESTIYSIGADGSDQRRLSTAVSGPSWSPDGERLAFAKPDGAELALYTIAADGSDAQRVATIPGKYWHPRYGEPDPTFAWIQTVAWSPAGGQILYTCGPAVCVVEVDGTPVGRSPSNVTDQTSRPVAAWSPDGSRIAIAGWKLLREDTALYTMAPDGTDLRILVRRDADAGLHLVGARRPGGPVDAAGCAAGAAVPAVAADPGLVQDCETLLAMRDVLAGGAELNWSADRPITEWEGVELGGVPPRVSGLKLVSRGLSGVIPSELESLTQLRELDLRANLLGGVIPPELGSLAELQGLFLHANHLSGGIPPELGGLTQLSALRLDDNYLHGIIPPELGGLTQLSALWLGDNSLHGVIPPELGQLANLQALDLSFNQLTDGIPAELGQLANLEYLSLYPNLLTGCIPPALQRVPNSDLRSLGLPDCE